MAALVVLGILVAGCATMTAEECAVADWERLGELDARAGYAPDYFARRASACADAGYPADRSAWTRGWDFGIVRFCTPDNGFRRGLEGYRYEGICPAHLEDEFLFGYEPAIGIYRAEERVGQTRSEIERAERRLDELRQQDPVDEDAVDRARDRLAVLNDRLRQQELELSRLQGVAQGQGFRVGY